MHLEKSHCGVCEGAAGAPLFAFPCFKIEHKMDDEDDLDAQAFFEQIVRQSGRSDRKSLCWIFSLSLPPLYAC